MTVRDGLHELRRGDVALLATPAFLDAARSLAHGPRDAWLALAAPPRDAAARAMRGGEAPGRAPVAVLAARRASGRGGEDQDEAHDEDGIEVSIVARAYAPGGLLARLRARSLPTPARPLAELRAHVALWHRGAPVAEPAFAVARRTARARRWHAVVASVRIDDAAPPAPQLRAATPDEVARVAAAAGTAVRAFHDAGGRHADLHLGNLLVDADGARAWVVDLDRAVAGAAPSPARRARELARLLRSLHKQGLAERVGEAGTRAFAAAYLRGDDALGRALTRAWPRARAGVLLHRLGFALARASR
ncbi:MAG: lipopolysaccharide kinase InaA family protein [Myxococcota bacterium]